MVRRRPLGKKRLAKRRAAWAKSRAALARDREPRGQLYRAFIAALKNKKAKRHKALRHAKKR